MCGAAEWAGALPFSTLDMRLLVEQQQQQQQQCWEHEVGSSPRLGKDSNCFVNISTQELICRASRDGLSTTIIVPVINDRTAYRLEGACELKDSLSTPARIWYTAPSSDTELSIQTQQIEVLLHREANTPSTHDFDQPAAQS